MVVSVRGVDFFVFCFVGRGHVPVEAIFKGGIVVVVFNVLELGLPAGQRAICLDEVGFGFGYEPVG